jgi:hypothetical protein
MPSFAGFDPKSLLTTVVKQALPTTYPDVPLDGPNGDELLVLCTRVHEPRVITRKSDGDQFCMWDTEWNIIDDWVLSQLNTDRVPARMSIRLEVDPVKGFLVDDTHNVALGRANKAVGLHTNWSLSQYEGLTAIGKIKIDVDEDDPEIKYTRVARLSPASRR